MQLLHMRGDVYVPMVPIEAIRGGCRSKEMRVVVGRVVRIKPVIKVFALALTIATEKFPPQELRVQGL
jgi:hypothetical protein